MNFAYNITIGQIQSAITNYIRLSNPNIHSWTALTTFVSNELFIEPKYFAFILARIGMNSKSHPSTELIQLHLNSLNVTSPIRLYFTQPDISLLTILQAMYFLRLTSSTDLAIKLNLSKDIIHNIITRYYYRNDMSRISSFEELKSFVRKEKRTDKSPEDIMAMLVDSYSHEFAMYMSQTHTSSKKYVPILPEIDISRPSIIPSSQQTLNYYDNLPQTPIITFQPIIPQFEIPTQATTYTMTQPLQEELYAQLNHHENIRSLKRRSQPDSNNSKKIRQQNSNYSEAFYAQEEVTYTQLQNSELNSISSLGIFNQSRIRNFNEQFELINNITIYQFNEVFLSYLSEQSVSNTQNSWNAIINHFASQFQVEPKFIIFLMARIGFNATKAPPTLISFNSSDSNAGIKSCFTHKDDSLRTVLHLIYHLDLFNPEEIAECINITVPQLYGIIRRTYLKENMKAFTYFDQLLQLKEKFRNVCKAPEDLITLIFDPDEPIKSNRIESQQVFSPNQQAQENSLNLPRLGLFNQSNLQFISAYSLPTNDTSEIANTDNALQISSELPQSSLESNDSNRNEALHSGEEVEKEFWAEIDQILNYDQPAIQTQSINTDLFRNSNIDNSNSKENEIFKIII